MDEFQGCFLEVKMPASDSIFSKFKNKPLYQSLQKAALWLPLGEGECHWERAGQS